MKEEQEIEQKSEEMEEIDLLQLARDVWNERKKLLIWTAAGALIGLIIGLSIPKEYTATIRMVTENAGGQNMSSSVSALAAMAGMRTQNVGRDGVNPQLYPDIVSSAPLVMELFDIHVTDKKGKMDLTLKEYIQKEISRPWWSAIVALPGRAIGGIQSWFEEKPTPLPISPSDSINMNENSPRRGVSTEPLRLSPGDAGAISAIASRVRANYDPKASIISISVTMQDPMVSAIVADTVAKKLQEYIIDYRTDKVRADLEYTQKLNDEAREEYYAAQKKYAQYVDRNQGVTLRSQRTEEERLQNEMQLAYGLFNTTSQQLQVAKAKVQEDTPVFTVLDPPRVPLKESKPSVMIYIVGCAFVAFALCAAWILFGRSLVAQFKAKGKTSELNSSDDNSRD